MSSFFRSSTDITDSEEEESSRNIPTVRSDVSISLRNQEPRHVAAPQTSDNSVNTYHQSVLLHALIEERCLNEVIAEVNRENPGTYTKDSERVKALAAQRYKTLSAQLSLHNLLTPGIEHDDYDNIRQKARDGLSLLSRNISNAQLAETMQLDGNQALVRQPFHDLINVQDRSFISRDLRNAAGHLAITALSPPRPSILTSPHPHHPLLDSTRYTRDFDELCTIGRGGYGTVFRCNHKLDGRSYAVKKVPLGSAVLYRIQQKGPGELNAILSELRLMAAMEHPNIVRYYTGWVEWVSSQHVSTDSNRKQSLLEEPDACTGASDANSQEGETSPVHTLTGSPKMSALLDDGNEIIFEDSISESRRCNKSKSSTQTDQQLNFGEQLMPSLTRNTLASVTDDDEIEFISREKTASFTSDSESGTTLQPSLTLHIQMSLYAFTLSDYLRSATVPLDNRHMSDSTTPVQSTTFTHCYHLPAAIHIFLLILSGVEYLHSQGMIHRDLKPGNIFLDPRHTRDPPVSSFDPLSCSTCRLSTSISPEHTRTAMKICIGDFGLVSAGSQPALFANQSVHSKTSDVPSVSAPRAVGTELYRPPSSPSGPASPALDVYALGIILFELLWRFGTRMERIETLGRLRRDGTFPGDFDEVVGHGGIGESVRSMIAEMLGFGREAGLERDVGCREVRAWAVGILEELG